MGRRKYNHSKNLYKKARYEAIELARLKKILGIEHVVQNNDITENIKDVAHVKPTKNVNEDKMHTGNDNVNLELQDELNMDTDMVEVKNANGKVRIYNTKTLKDQYGNYPPWFKHNKTTKRLRKRAHARKKNLKQ